MIFNDVVYIKFVYERLRGIGTVARRGCAAAAAPEPGQSRLSGRRLVRLLGAADERTAGPLVTTPCKDFGDTKKTSLFNTIDCYCYTDYRLLILASRKLFQIMIFIVL